MIDDGWLEWTQRRIGPGDKKNVETNSISGIVAHSMVGGYAGARLARRLPANLLRAAIVVAGLIVGIILAVRAF